MRCIFLVSYLGFLTLMVFLTSTTADCMFEVAGNCSSSNCSVETGRFDNIIKCYNLNNNLSHRCGYRKALPVEFGVKLPEKTDVSQNRIPDKNMDASSNRQNAKRGRIGAQILGNYVKAWCAAENDNNPWLQVNFDRPTNTERIQIKGYPDSQNKWVEKFSVSYYDGSTWIMYRDGHLFNSSVNGSCHYVFMEETRSIRVISNSTWNRTCIQLAVYGRPPDAILPTPNVIFGYLTTTSSTIILSALSNDEFFKGYFLWAIFLAVFLFLLLLTLCFLFCWCCRKPKKQKSAMQVVKETNPGYIPAWRRIDAKAETGYIQAQEIQEVKIAFTDEYIPPNLKKEKQDPNNDEFYRNKIFSFSGCQNARVMNGATRN